MGIYRQIVFGIDLHPNCDFTVARKVQNLAKVFGAELTFVHAVEHINTYGIGQAYPSVLDIEDSILEAAKKEMGRLADDLGIPVGSCVVELGSPKAVLFHQVKARQADLLVVGSHGRHGLALLFGSTASNVTHGAECDVMAIRIRDDDDVK